MTFTGGVGDTFRLKDNPPFSNHYVILTTPNDSGKVIIAMFAKPIKGIQVYVMFTPQQDGRLFPQDRTVRFPDLKFKSQIVLVDYINEKSDMEGHQCYHDIIVEIVKGAFRAKQSLPSVLLELQHKYPELYNEVEAEIN